MNKINLALMLILVISGCVTGSKAVKPSSGETGQFLPAIPAIEESIFPEPQPVVYNTSVESAISAVPVKPESRFVKESMLEPVKIKYSQITNLISEFIDMKENNAAGGENNYIGVSEDKLVKFQIRGNKDDVKEASMKLSYPKGMDNASVKLNNAMMSRFLKNAAPELPDWHSRIKKILNKFDSMKAGAQGISEEDMKLSNKNIKVLYDKNLDYIIVTLKKAQY